MIVHMPAVMAASLVWSCHLAVLAIVSGMTDRDRRM
jgi:hypothetical protein